MLILRKLVRVFHIRYKIDNGSYVDTFGSGVYTLSTTLTSGQRTLGSGIKLSKSYSKADSSNNQR